MRYCEHAEFLGGFGCPQVGIDTAFLNLLVVGQGAQVMDELAARPELGAEKLCAMLRSGVETDHALSAMWDLPYGELLAAMLGYEPQNSRKAMAALALKFNELGVEGSWSTNFDKDAVLLFDRTLFRCATLDVTAVKGFVVLRATNERGESQTIEFWRNRNRWRSSGGRSIPHVEWQGECWRLFPSEGISSTVVANHLLHSQMYGMSDEDFELECQSLAASVKAALSLISEYVPIYLPWVTRLVSTILPLRSAPGAYDSTTAYFAPGVIATSNHADPVLTAEMLVHEASHQYLYALMRLGPLDDGTDQELYYSPFKGSGRRIMLIVLTYHAFGNVLLFHRILREVDSGSIETTVDISSRIEWLEQRLAVIEAHLKGAKSLTAIGECLWQSVNHALETSK